MYHRYVRSAMSLLPHMKLKLSALPNYQSYLFEYQRENTN